MARLHVTGTLQRDHVACERTPHAVELHKRGAYGALLKTKLKLSLYEAAYLEEKGWLTLASRAKSPHDLLLRAGTRLDREFPTKHAVYADLRSRGYTVKTALKYGADFRVYGKGVRPGQAHAKWIVFPVRESARMTWYDFAAKNRVAHSTRKNLLIGVVDAEEDVTYFQVSWERP